jgi:ATP-binding cassette subfamily B protein
MGHFMLKVMTDSLPAQTIEIPAYKVEPPYGGTVWKWILFFISPFKLRLLFWYFMAALRRGMFSTHPLFIAIIIGVVEQGKASEDPSVLLFWLGLYAFVQIVAYYGIIIYVPAGKLIDLVTKHLSIFGFRHYLRLPESWHADRASGEKLQRLLSARKGMERLMDLGFWRVSEIPGLVIVLIVTMITLEAPWYYLLMYLGFMTSFGCVGIWTGKWLSAGFERENETLEKVVGGVYEFVLSTSTVKSFNLKKHAMTKAGALEYDNHASLVNILWIVIRRWSSLNTVGLIWAVLITGLATYQIVNGEISLPVYSALMLFNLTVWNTSETLVVTHKDSIEYWESIRRLVEVLNQQPAIVDADDAYDLVTDKASIEFDNVNFQYNENRDVIDRFNLTVAAGEKVGMLGPSGAGKSTIVKLLLRFYDVDTGEIRIGGQAIKDVTLPSLQQAIAVIPQDVTLFNHPLIENIRYGRLDATDEEVMEAAKSANAHEFILQLPEGYQTVVGERGVKLSGGQRQRIAIARAILKDAPILILDEATSALDSESEHLIQQSLKDLMRDKTVIAIAHRLSTIASLDRLVVMDKGRIVEEGRHEALLKQGGMYAQLWNMQSGGFLQ